MTWLYWYAAGFATCAIIALAGLAAGLLYVRRKVQQRMAEALAGAFGGLAMVEEDPGQ